MSLPVWKGVHRVKVTHPPPQWGQNIHLPAREAPVHVLLLSQPESTRAAQCKQINAEGGEDCSRKGLCPANGRAPPTVATLSAH